MKEQRRWSVLAGCVIPFVYTYNSRMNHSMAGLAKWVFEFLLLTFGLFVLATGRERVDVVGFLLMTTLVYTLYELGYFWNDTVTIRKEQHPTLRLSGETLACAFQYRYLVLVIRLLLAILITIGLFRHYGHTAGVVRSMTVTWMIPLVYVFHNNIRGSWTHLSHFLLLCCRYLAATLLPMVVWSWKMPVLAILMFPLPNILEILAMGKFGLAYSFTRFYLPKYENRYLFRALYHAGLMIATWLLWGGQVISIECCVFVSAYFTYQLAFCIFKGLEKRTPAS